MLILSFVEVENFKSKSCELFATLVRVPMWNYGQQNEGLVFLWCLKGDFVSFETIWSPNVPRLRSSFKTPYENTHPDHFCLWKYPGRPLMLMIQTLPRSKFWRVHVLVRKRLWKDLSRPKYDMIQTLARSTYEKTHKDQTIRYIYKILVRTAR